MSYFNKKEEVLDIQLTQYGKHLLSIGKLNPTYYQFFDEGVLYDSECASFEELQNEAHERIVNNTPNKKTQHNHVGLETEIKKDYNEKQKPYTVAEFEKVNMSAGPQRDFVLSSPLGNSMMGENRAPSFKLEFLSGEVDNFSPFLTGTHQDLRIPQIEMDLVYNLDVVDYETEGIDGTDPELASPVFSDGTAIVVRTDHILGMMLETGVSFELENFDIEVYEEIEIDQGPNNPAKKDLKKLTFARNRKSSVVDGILMDFDEMRQINKMGELTPDNVEYYFDIHVDEEIPESIICEELSNVKSKSLFADMKVNCPEVSYTDKIIDPYSSEIDLNKARICNDEGDQ